MKKYTRTIRRILIAGAACICGLASTQAAGLLTPVGSVQTPLQLESHHVDVVINNGFAKTEVEQVFRNLNTSDLEAIYTAPVPKSGSLAELTIWAGERVLQGEVVSKEEADRIYEVEKSSGNDVGKADKSTYQNFEFSVYPVPANGSVRMRYVYYEPLKIDTGVGRYLYPLEEGGTDFAAESFWSRNDTVEGDFSVTVTLKSAYPISKTRVPHYGGQAEVDDAGDLVYRFDSKGAALDEDFVFYYMLEEGLPGRLEMLTYRENEDKPGTFMMVMTPGVDLRPLSKGSDYVFVLDVSGSMNGKLHTLISGVKKAIGKMSPEDRFRIVAFNNAAWDLSRGWVAATESNLRETLHRLDKLTSDGGTNLYAGIHLGLDRLDADRVSSLILVTDGVTNQGIVDPKAFYGLMEQQDVRFFGFLLGNSSNWPLMELVAEASGGTYRSVSNADDIIGEVLIAKSKITHEAMRNAKLRIEGVNTYDVGSLDVGKIHFGDQLLLFGRYENGGKAKVTLEARVNGEDRSYETEIVFPEIDTVHPELERMWALDQVSKIEVASMAGFLPSDEAEDAIRDIGIAFQIVTDETSMIALDDEGFNRHGVERRNLQRVANEQAAQVANPNRSGAQRVDTASPMYQQKSHSVGGGGGGAIENWFVGLIAVGGVALAIRKRRMSLSTALAVGLFAGAMLLAGVATASAKGQNELRWTDREANLETGNSSIDRSIANFWEVSEEDARVEARVSRSVSDKAARDEGQSYTRIEYERSRDTHALEQSRDRGSRRGHFGINLLNAIPLVDVVWGEDSSSERDAYSGNVTR